MQSENINSTKFILFLEHQKKTKFDTISWN